MAPKYLPFHSDSITFFVGRFFSDVVIILIILLKESIWPFVYLNVLTKGFLSFVQLAEIMLSSERWSTSLFLVVNKFLFAILLTASLCFWWLYLWDFREDCDYLCFWCFWMTRVFNIITPTVDTISPLPSTDYNRCLPSFPSISISTSSNRLQLCGTNGFVLYLCYLEC